MRTMTSVRCAVIAVVVAFASGCDLLPLPDPSDKAVVELPPTPDGARERCGPADHTCNQRAVELVKRIAADLGSSFSNVKPPGDAVSTWVTISRSPPFSYRTADGETGQTPTIAVEITTARRGGGGVASVLVGGAWRSFGADDELGRALIEALYVMIE